MNKAEIIKEALKIVDALADNDLDELDGNFTSNDFDYTKLQNLIKRSKNLKKKNEWKLY